MKKLLILFICAGLCAGLVQNNDSFACKGLLDSCYGNNVQIDEGEVLVGGYNPHLEEEIPVEGVAHVPPGGEIGAHGGVIPEEAALHELELLLNNSNISTGQSTPQIVAHVPPGGE
ncbi:hypothetical protein [Candidatus Hydrogenosomobacter endosymbioticus]|uniref:Uncharacterized protein n=1 Tax=Candidatus Hydrogenosomobacter endosymbioticus TaxID=2558174 RepID=A0ABM7V9P3_9PROT|nr:hypothetical protein [Candidatus Hydrogenosomobacter endosymbioticus]BDB96501.1 hypothetical protein HYD_6340 [Candidatus Hydrogenosomobacter endosymbioticus]